MTEASESLRD